jgi:hypothetical protein
MKQAGVDPRVLATLMATRLEGGMSGTAEFTVISWGLVAASVCTSLPLPEATARLNLELPTGISSRWQPSEDPTFATGQPNPCPCEQRSGNQHYLFNC